MVAEGDLADEFAPRKSDSDPQADGKDNAAEIASLAAYIADMSAELALLAARSALPMLAHFLNLARVEAEIRSRELRGLDLPRRASRGKKEARKGASPQTQNE